MRRIPNVPSIDPSLPDNIKTALQPIKELLEIREGIRSAGVALGNGSGYNGYLRRNVTLGMLVKLGIITDAQAKQVSGDE